MSLLIRQIALDEIDVVIHYFRSSKLWRLEPLGVMEG
jgi:hypothetical protein